MTGSVSSLRKGRLVYLTGALIAWGRGFKFFARRFARNRGAVVGLVGVCLISLLAIASGLVAPYDPHDIVAKPFQAPSGGYWMGTDDLGRDVLSGVIFGGRASLMVGLVSAGMAVVIGVVIGAVSGYYGGKLGDLLMRLTEMFMVVPQFFLAILIVAFFGSGFGKIILVIGILSWPTVARLVRAQFLWLKEQQFVEAARSLGMSAPGIILGEILPNAIPPAIVAGSLQIARAILLEASLSFLGLGDPNIFSWGTLLHDAQPFLRQAWWIALWPGLAISIVVLAFNLVGDGLNDALNPRTQER